MIGKHLNHYRITAKLGEGGMGEVWLAEDTRLKREVALKMLPERLAADPDRRERFEREAQAVAALNHPNIVTIHAVEECDGRFFLAMERVDGVSLTARIAAGGLPVHDLFALAIPLADAVGAAHERGITHRDLKPDNVMIRENGLVKVLDFGLAKLSATDGLAGEAGGAPTATVTAEGRIVGTVAYMSPEQAEGKPVDARSDVFSLGILLYEMATGTRPFAGDTPISTISSILRDTPTSLTDLNRTLPRHLDRIVARCLHKDPDRRYPDARELRNELEQLKGEVESGVTAAPPRPSGWGRVVVPMIAGVVLIAGGLYWRSRAPETDGAVAVDAAAPGATRIVVLPFENVGNPEDEFFTAGITEEVATRLSNVADLGVIAPDSARRYVDGDVSIREIGDGLDVDYVLRGSVRWAGGAEQRVRITPRLIRVADETQVWARSYDETVDDVFTVQSRIARTVVDQMGIALGGAEQVERAATESLEAWEAYRRAEGFTDEAARSQIELGIRMYERAIELDPLFVEAWSGLSEAHAGMVHYAYDTTPERKALSLAAAREAGRLAPGSNAFHLAMGYYHYWCHRDYDAALDAFDRVLDRLPNHRDALSGRAYVRRRAGDWEGARRDLRRAFELDPHGKRAAMELGATELAFGNFEQARSLFRRSIDERPEFPEPYFWLSRSYGLDGQVEEAGRVRASMPEVTRSEEQTFLNYSQALFEGDTATAIDIVNADPRETYSDAPSQLPREVLIAIALRTAGDAEAAARAVEPCIAGLESAYASPEEAVGAAAPLAIAYALTGRPEDALTTARHATELYGLDRDAFFGFRVESYAALAEAYAGAVDAAIDRLEKLVSRPNPEISRRQVAVDPRWIELRDHPRFRRLVAN